APTVTTDFDGVTRPQGLAYDIGAYEYISAVSPALLIAYWKFDECSGQTLVDSTGINAGLLGFNAATETSDPARAAGKSGGGIFLDSIDDIASIPLTASTQNLSSFTYTAWINPKSSGQNTYGRIISRESSIKFDDFFFLTYPGSTVSAELINTAGTAFNSVASSSAITLNAWNHVAVTYSDAGDRKLHLFVNGIETSYSTQDIVTGTLKYTANPISIGNAPSQDRTFDGAIDEVCIYNKALTASEVQGVYNKTLAAPLAPLSFTLTVTSPVCGNNNGSSTVAAAGGTSPYTYSWSNGNTTATVTGLTGNPTQTLIATITDANSCTVKDTVIVQCVTGITNYDLQNQFTIYPNPNNGTLTIATKEDKYSITITNVLGEKVYSSIINSQSTIINIDAPGGIYFLSIKTEKESFIKKLIIQK
ncbi:MAG: T9SS type A sorting domain-containing protein, partial [Bacteroidetes bacterium]